MTDCQFCEIVSERAAADGLIDYGDVVSFIPLGPVTPGHRLFVPRQHVRDAGQDPAVTGRVMAVAARWLPGWDAANLITSMGVAATQTVFHLHVHLVPRRVDDGLALPWTTR